MYNKDMLKACTLCPRECGANRIEGHAGYCGQTGRIMAARASLHMWEEPCISGQNGSGTVFFSGCSLGCVYCQNHAIASGRAGRAVSIERLSEIFLELQEKGAHNINLVTPTHFIPQIAEGLTLAKNNGFSLPVVYNTGSYEKAESLKLLDGLIDIYLPDLKYHSSELSQRYSQAADYFLYASQAIAEMFRQVGRPVFDDASGLMKRGMIIRHLVLPGCVRDSKKILKYLYRTYGDAVYISILNQFTPVPGLDNYPELNRAITDREYNAVVDFAVSLGIENGFIQEGGTASESFIPPFDGEGIS